MKYKIFKYEHNHTFYVFKIKNRKIIYEFEGSDPSDVLCLKYNKRDELISIIDRKHFYKILFSINKKNKEELEEFLFTII